MKNITQKQKIIISIIALIIIAGIIVTATIGLKYDLKFDKTKKVEVYLGKSFEISDIKKIAKETIVGQDIIVETIEVYEDTARIIAKEITEEQKASLISKLNEKFGTELTADSLAIVSIPNVQAIDFIKPYIIPFGIATTIILLYISIRYRKLGILKLIGITVITLIILQLLLFSVIAIARIPVGRLTIPMVVTIYIIGLVLITNKFEKQLTTKQEDVKK